jgi:hypothetical protein
MPISFKVKQDYGDSVYLVNDVEQKQYTLIKVILNPGNVCYVISDGRDDFTVYDFMCSFERNDALRLSFKED